MFQVTVDLRTSQRRNWRQPLFLRESWTVHNCWVHGLTSVRVLKKGFGDQSLGGALGAPQPRAETRDTALKSHSVNWPPSFPWQQSRGFIACYRLPDGRGLDGWECGSGACASRSDLPWPEGVELVASGTIMEYMERRRERFRQSAGETRGRAGNPTETVQAGQFASGDDWSSKEVMEAKGRSRPTKGGKGAAAAAGTWTTTAVGTSPDPAACGTSAGATLFARAGSSARTHAGWTLEWLRGRSLLRQQLCWICWKAAAVSTIDGAPPPLSSLAERPRWVDRRTYLMRLTCFVSSPSASIWLRDFEQCLCLLAKHVHTCSQPLSSSHTDLFLNRSHWRFLNCCKYFLKAVQFTCFFRLRVPIREVFHQEENVVDIQQGGGAGRCLGKRFVYLFIYLFGFIRNFCSWCCSLFIVNLGVTFGDCSLRFCFVICCRVYLPFFVSIEPCILEEGLGLRRPLGFNKKTLRRKPTIRRFFGLTFWLPARRAATGLGSRKTSPPPDRSLAAPLRQEPPMRPPLPSPHPRHANADPSRPKKKEKETEKNK